MPAMPLMARSATDPFQQDINGESTFDPIPRGNAPADQHEPGKSVKPKIQEESHPGPRERRFEKTYIVKHIERLAPGEDNTRQSDDHTKSITTNYIAPEANTAQVKSTENGHPEKNVSGDQEPVNIYMKPNTEPGDKKTTPAENERPLIEPSPTTAPIPESKKITHIETLKIVPKVAKLNPPLPNPVAPVAKGNRSAPKLVIGKISVEILPPAAPQPAKVVTRVVQAPSYSESSKTNKLRFGLGQL
jgi:hypothetical protein